MDTPEKSFADIVQDRLNELGTNAFAVENAAGLKKDTIRSVIRTDGRRSLPRIDTAKKICEALGLDFHIGPWRPTDNRPIPSKSEFTQIPHYDIEVSAGPGAANGEELPHSSVAFRRDWLTRNGLAPNKCVIVGVSGDSMEPTLYDGDLVMIDRRSVAVRDMRLYAIVDTDGSARVKRLQRTNDTLILHSDNRTYPAEMRTSDLAANVIVIGEVVWSGHRFSR